jgi:hypothetical protein
MQGEDRLNEARDASGRAAELAEQPPGLEGGDGLLDECSDLRVGPVDRLLSCGEGLPPSARQCRRSLADRKHRAELDTSSPDG